MGKDRGDGYPEMTYDEFWHGADSAKDLFLDRVQGLVSQITYRENYKLLVREDDRLFIQVECYRPDALTGEMGFGRGGKGYLSPYMTDGEIVQLAFGLLKAYEEHECREFFRYKGKAIFGPHIALDALLEIADRTELRAPMEKK